MRSSSSNALSIYFSRVPTRHRLRRAALLGLLILAPPSAWAAEAPLPEYVCHPAHEGQALQPLPEMLKRVKDTNALPAQQAIDSLRALREKAGRSKVDAPLIDFGIAWRLSELGQHQAARDAARSVLDNVYIPGKLVDLTRALIAQTHVDEGQWQAAVDVLAPVTAAACRDLPDAWRYLLATAYLKLKQYPDALREIDAAQPGNSEEDLQWLRAALTIDCSLNGAAACTTRVLDYAKEPAPANAVQALLDEQIAELLADPSLDAGIRLRFDEARTQGMLDADYRLIARAPPQIEELQPIKTVLPEYPYLASSKGQQGYVTLRITIHPDGTVKHAEVRDSAPAHIFDKSALAAASKNRYRPKQVDGVAVETTGIYTVHYRMADEP